MNREECSVRKKSLQNHKKEGNRRLAFSIH